MGRGAPSPALSMRGLPRYAERAKARGHRAGRRGEGPLSPLGAAWRCGDGDGRNDLERAACMDRREGCPY
jgi:hypothetical protein